MYAWQLIPAVIIVYNNMHGDKYPFMSVHIDMLGDKQNRTDQKLYFSCLK